MEAERLRKGNYSIFQKSPVPLPAVGEVQVREEQHPTAEEGEQHEDSVEFVQQSVLLLVLEPQKKKKVETMVGVTKKKMSSGLVP